jgi:Tol biopolymer transport system component
LNHGAWARIALLLAIVTTPAAAQYFGRNKVQYRTFEFEILKTEHFDVYLYPAEREAAAQAARLAERWYTRLSQVLQAELHTRQPLLLYASHPDFEQTNAITGELGEGTGGVTEIFKRRIVVPLAGPLAETDHVIGHELVHAFQFDITGQRQGGFEVPGAARLPLWFVEGMAEYLSLGPVDVTTAMWLRDASVRGALPTMRQLYDVRFFPYRFGHAFWAFVAGRYGDQALGEVLRRAGKSGDPEGALRAVTGMRADSLALAWHAAVAEDCAAPTAAAQPPGRFGLLLVGTGPEPGINVAPALSPDGSQLAFFSEKGRLSIDLYLADARTGRITRRVTRTALDPHYQSLGFINSAGAWDPSGTRLAFGAVSAGTAVLAVLDVRSGRFEREIPLPAVGEIFNPTWSPDGGAVAFAALAGGYTDLFRYDLASGVLTRLTEDAYADLEPAWSPDGREIAFVTDRFSTSLDDLRLGNYRLAIFDVSRGAIHELPVFAGANHIDPQWAPDGASLYFVADRGGVPDVYRVERARGVAYQVTRLQTGVSGITHLSPALSVAGRSGRMVVSVYEGLGYRLYAVDDPAVLAGTLVPPAAPHDAAALPPTGRVASQVLELLGRPDSGLVADTGFTPAPYRPRFTLDYVAPPSVAVGVSSFGTFVGGGTALYWSDMLGNRTLVTMLQVSGGVKDIAALVAYQNARRRWNWGVVAQQIPLYSGAYGATTGTVNGEPAYIEAVELQRETNRQLAALTAYALSKVQRLEFALGVQGIGFDVERSTRATSRRTGLVLYDSSRTLAGPSAITLATGGAAIVYDNSLFGATSPILGQRYRLELVSSAGNIAWLSALADYRRYVMPLRPFTLAGRLLHYGRYGSGAEDERLSPLFLGYTSLVRGYNLNSFSAAECPSDAAGCPVFDQLLGSRLLVGNLELRFPPLGVLGVGRGYYGAAPIELALFADAGVAWTDAHRAALFGGDRELVSSAGAALRVNLLGYVIVELDLVRPFDRPGKGWFLELSLTPGF